MNGYTENNIVILREFDFVFDLTNSIELWPKLFTEYKEAEILDQSDNTVKFRLTTYPDGDRLSRTWISTRTIEKDKKIAYAKRIDPTFPFAYMNIRWEYQKLPNNIGVVMTWIQDFDVHLDCKFTVEKMESFLNRNTLKQMRAVKHNVENWVGPFTK